MNVEVDYPLIHEHLLTFKQRLTARQDKGTEWYNLRSCAYLDEFDKPKIIWGNLSVKPRFSLNESGAYLFAPCNILSSRSVNLHYLLAVLNSSIAYFFMRQQAYSREGGYIEYKKFFVEQLPIPCLSNEVQSSIARLAIEVTANKNRGLLTADLEAEIDALILSNCGLTKAEISYLTAWSAVI